MPRAPLQFKNASGHTLSGLLELPDEDIPVRCYALFAHCFTCGKDNAAASRIARFLAEKGIAVLRFDFTGLGGSDGDFANTNFSSNIQDLVAAAQALQQSHQAPSLLIGHSLGGAAVLAAAHFLPSVKAIATIAAPSTAEHLEHLFGGALAAIEAEGEACVILAGREFTIKQQLLDDIRRYESTEEIGNLRKALLIFHSPEDEVVPVGEAARIYAAARHPKSFISLTGADHLLSDKRDAEYVATTLAAWASRYLEGDV